MTWFSPPEFVGSVESFAMPLIRIVPTDLVDAKLRVHV
jgi:hypothetical protein